MGVRSPQTDEQCAQVSRLLAQVHARRRREREDRIKKEAELAAQAAAASAKEAREKTKGEAKAATGGAAGKQHWLRGAEERKAEHPGGRAGTNPPQASQGGGAPLRG